MQASRLALVALLAAAPVTQLHSQSPSLDSLDAFIKAQMARRQVNGLSLAIIQDGKIAVARGYGVTDRTTRAPVTPNTLFQAGSISKPVAAMGALHLVEAGRLVLDEDVNTRLKSWKLPENAFTVTEKVTLRRILSHSGGLTVHGFPGYDVNQPRPTLVQVLNGTRPANTDSIRVDTTPGTIWRYSGGGFTIMQQLVIDVTGKPFPLYMQETVLGPIGMSNSSYDQPQPPARAARTANGYYTDRTPVRGRWHVYPEMAAAGLWTTASDLARFVIEVQETLAGHGHGVISPAMARQYLTVQKDDYGLGIGLAGTGPALRFSHGGRDEGFDAWMEGTAESGQGVVIMINGNDNANVVDRIARYVAAAYHWPATGAAAEPAARKGIHQDPARLRSLAGYYEVVENQMVILASRDDGTGLSALIDGLPGEDFLALDSLHFGSSDRNLRIAFVQASPGAAPLLVWREGEPRERRAPRVVPLPSSRSPVTDPDPALTTRLTAVVAALQQGGQVLADAPDVSPGAKKDFRDGVRGQLDELGPLAYLGEEDVSGRGIHRHGEEVARVRYYKTTLKGEPGYLLFHLRADGKLADYDTGTR
ncbi:MAG: serine hydrolase domain-containing protein [Gemmatimonadota bacterium]